MESLRVLYLAGNSVISKIKNYRKTLTLKCVSFAHYFLNFDLITESTIFILGVYIK